MPSARIPPPSFFSRSTMTFRSASVCFRAFSTFAAKRSFIATRPWHRPGSDPRRRRQSPLDRCRKNFPRGPGAQPSGPRDLRRRRLLLQLCRRSDSLLNKNTVAALNRSRVYFPDLSNECQVDKGPHVRAIGWLSSTHDFPKGEVPAYFFEKLRAHLQNPWQPVVTWGRYRCNLCPAHISDDLISGSRNLWVPGDAFVYVAPELILHYIEVHLYKPPDEFINAVLNSPEPNSSAFLEAMQKLTARWGSTS